MEQLQTSSSAADPNLGRNPGNVDPGSISNTAELEAENAKLRARLRDADELIRAIRDGEVDAVIVGASGQGAVYTFFGADHPYRMLVESMGEGAVTLAQDGTVLYANPSFARIVRRPQPSLIGSLFTEYVRRADLPLFQALMAQEGEDKAELALVTPDGTRVTVYLSRSPVDLVGTHGVCLVVTDLTRQKREEEIVAAERLARSILDQAAEAIIVCDSNGRVTRANQQAALLCRCNLLLKPFGEVIQLQIEGETSEVSTERLLEIARGLRSAASVEATCTDADDKRRRLLLSGSPLVGNDGDVLGAVIILSDVTLIQDTLEALKTSERKLRILNRTLEQQVEERTSELSRANVALSRKNDELQEFAYAASHDLREPLRKVATFSSMLREDCSGSLSANGIHYLDRMENAAHRMAGLLSDLLIYSRVTTHAKPFTRVELNEAVHQALDDLEVLLNETDARVDVADLPVIEADEAQICRLFENLIKNGIVFQQPGHTPHIQIRAELVEEQDEQFCRIEVEDDGIGFDDKYLDRIFVPFQRLHGKNSFPGSGIGLAICQRVVERHGGSITARSTQQEGSTFVITLPVRQR